MERWLLAAESNCSDPSQEEEFNRWYDETHLPDVLETPGILRATRYENISAGEGQGKFLALYEIETEDIEQTNTVFGENMARKLEQGRISELLVAVSGALYRQITAPIERK